MASIEVLIQNSPKYPVNKTDPAQKIQNNYYPEYLARYLYLLSISYAKNFFSQKNKNQVQNFRESKGFFLGKIATFSLNFQKLINLISLPSIRIKNQRDRTPNIRISNIIN